MTIIRKKPDPNHHNTGRPQSPHQEFVSAVNWWAHFQLKSLTSNARSAAARVIHHRFFFCVPEEDRARLHELYKKQRNLLDQLDDLQKEVAEWNVTRGWID